MLAASMLIAAMSLTDLYPGLVWQDPGNLLPGVVEPVPSESLRINRAYMGEYYGIVSALTERYPYVIPEDLSTLKTNNLMNVWPRQGRDYADEELSTNRVVSTRRMSDARILDSAFRCCRSLYESGAELSAYQTNAMPTFGWTTNVYETARSLPWQGATQYPAGCSRADGALLEYDGLENSIFGQLMDSFWTTNSWYDFDELVDVYTNKNYAPTPMEVLEREMSGMPNASPWAITNATLRVDRGKLTALECAAALIDTRTCTYGVELPVYKQTKLTVKTATSDVLGPVMWSAASNDWVVADMPEWSGTNEQYVATTSLYDTVWGPAFAATRGTSFGYGSGVRAEVPLELPWGVITNMFARLPPSGEGTNVMELLDYEVYDDHHVCNWNFLLHGTNSDASAVYDSFSLSWDGLTGTVHRAAYAEHYAPEVIYTAPQFSLGWGMQGAAWKNHYITDAELWTAESNLSICDTNNTEEGWGIIFNENYYLPYSILEFMSEYPWQIVEYRHRFALHGDYQTTNQLMSVIASTVFDAVNGAVEKTSELSGGQILDASYVEVPDYEMDRAKSECMPRHGSGGVTINAGVTITQSAGVTTYSGDDGTYVINPGDPAVLGKFVVTITYHDSATNREHHAAMSVRASDRWVREHWQYRNCRRLD